MKTFGLILSVAVCGLLGQAAWAGDCGCDSGCGCDGCGNLCQLKVGTKKIKVICYGCECDQVCMPCPSTPGCKHCESVCDGKACDCQCGHAPECKVRWRDWCPADGAKTYDRKKLVKYEVEKEVPDYKWVVVPCGGAAPSGSPAGKDAVPTPAKPAPKSAKVGDVYPLTDAEVKQLNLGARSANAVRPASHVTRGGQYVAQQAGGANVGAKGAARDYTPWSLFSK